MPHHPQMNSGPHKARGMALRAQPCPMLLSAGLCGTPPHRAAPFACSRRGIVVSPSRSYAREAMWGLQIDEGTHGDHVEPSMFRDRDCLATALVVCVSCAAHQSEEAQSIRRRWIRARSFRAPTLRKPRQTTIPAIPSAALPSVRRPRMSSTARDAAPSPVPVDSSWLQVILHHMGGLAEHAS